MATIHTADPVIEERHIHTSDDSSSAIGMIAVLLVAAVLIIGFLLFAMRAYPFNGSSGSRINVELPAANTTNTTPTAPGSTTY